MQSFFPASVPLASAVSSHEPQKFGIEKKALLTQLFKVQQTFEQKTRTTGLKSFHAHNSMNSLDYVIWL